MTKSILLQPIKTPNGDTDAYAVISFLLEEQANNYGSMPCDAEMYSETLSHLNQLMEGE